MGKEQIEAVVEDPVFPGIRDVTPDYTEEGKKFRTIPIGAGPDYAPVIPEPPSEIVQPVEPVVPEEPEISQPQPVTEQTQYFTEKEEPKIETSTTQARKPRTRKPRTRNKKD